MLTPMASLEPLLQQLLQNTNRATQRLALREIARYLLKANQQRIRRNVQANGKAMTPAQHKQRMFKRMGKYLKADTQASGASVDFQGKAATIATNHQLGKTLQRQGFAIHLPVRELLGLSHDDQQAVTHILLKYVTQGLEARLSKASHSSAMRMGAM